MNQDIIDLVKNNKNIIMVGGLGASGSSAICDLLKEVDGIYLLQEELRIITDPDGILSLKSSIIDNWNIYQSERAINRFRKLCHNLYYKNSAKYFRWSNREIFNKNFLERSEEFIDSLIEFEYKGLWLGQRSLLTAVLNKMFNKTKYKEIIWKKIEVTRLLSEREYYIIASNYINKIIEKNNMEYSDIVIDEGYCSMVLDNVFKLFPNMKMIMVIRDPRSIYAESMKWNFLPKSVNEFIKYQILLLKRWEKIKNKLNYNILEITFEELICDYDNVIKKIFTYLEIDNDRHRNKKKYLIPEESIKNVNRWKDEVDYRISNIIYGELKDYYPFIT